jgi:hypothetical protein
MHARAGRLFFVRPSIPSPPHTYHTQTGTASTLLQPLIQHTHSHNHHQPPTTTTADWDRIDALLAITGQGGSVRVDQNFFADMMSGFVQSGRWRSAANLLRVLGEGDSTRLSAGFYEQVRGWVCVCVCVKGVGSW